MNRTRFGTFLERLGHRVVASDNCIWYDLQPRFLMAVPHPKAIAPDPAELSRVFRATRAMGVRFLADGGPGRSSFAFMLDDPAYDVEHLSANTRSKVRRGLKNCTVERIDAAYARAHAQAANTDALTRMRFEKDLYPWDHYWDAVAAVPEMEVWGAMREGDLLAYLVVAPVEGCAEFLVARSQTEGLRFYPNNALIFAAAQDYLRRPEIHRILFGMEAMESVDGVDQFKESMGFARQPITQRIVFHPLLDRLLRRTVVTRVLRGIARRRGGEFWRKVDGVLSLYSLQRGQDSRKEASSWIS